MTTLEEILQQNFDCSQPFYADGTLTSQGEIATEKLLGLLKDCASIGIVDDSMTEGELDKICAANCAPEKKYINELYALLTEEKEEGQYVMLRQGVDVEFRLDGEKMNVRYLLRDLEYRTVLIASDEECDDARLLDDLTLDSIKKIYEEYKAELIDDGWDWKEHARHAFAKAYPDISEEEKEDFIIYEWKNLLTDKENIENVPFATSRRGMAALQSQYDAARKTYNSIKKELGGKSKRVSVGFYAEQIMKKRGMKTPSEIRQQMDDLAKSFWWYTPSF